MTAHHVLVTGASGFLGREIVLEIGDRCPVLATGRRQAFAVESNADYVAVDLLADDLGARFPAGVDTIVHAAGVTSSGAEELTKNLDMTRRVVDWGIKAGARNTVLISSAAVYDPAVSPRLENTVCAPRSAYGRSKLASEQYAIEKCTDAGVGLTILRKPALIGPTRNGNISRLIRSLGRNRFVLLGNGNNRKSLISVRDAARACAATLTYLENEQPQTPNIFNVSSGAMSMREIIDTVCEELGRKPPPKLPAGLATMPLKTLSAMPFGARSFGELLATVEQFLRDDVLDASLFAETVGFEPVMSLDRALRDMVHHQERNP